MRKQWYRELRRLEMALKMRNSQASLNYPFGVNSLFLL